MKNGLNTKLFKLNISVVEKQFDVLYSFTRSLAYHESIKQDLTNFNENYDFFFYTMNSHILKSITEWCMIFGTNGNEIHWKKTSLSHSDEFYYEIKNLIYQSTGFSQNEWETYYDVMLNFRNNYVAHRNPHFKKSFPNMDNALNIAVVFFDWLKGQLQPCYNEPESLNILYPKFQIEALLVYDKFLKNK